MSQENEYNVHVLLAVWGEEYINDFLQFSLPSLLSPGNIPALAQNYKTQFVFLTQMQDVPTFKKSNVFQKLAAVCEVEFVSIDDLIVFGNYSTTLTFCYDRAIKQTGQQMLNTYFVFLTSDYIMADGSMEGLVRYIKRGYSGICTGNFQVIKENIKPFLLSQINPDTQVMQIKPRDLLKESFQHLHSVVIASLYNQSIAHNYKANRFFFQHDRHIMCGRFYLLHMLCIKPETTDYKIGSSCDYSFIPEMCPSGNIAIINDSDDYLVVEIQAKSHELDFVHWGQYDIHHLAHALSEWTTRQHRENAKHSIYFHTKDLAEQDTTRVEKNLSQFIDKLTIGLQNYKPQPHNNHPYWIGALKAFNEQRRLLGEVKNYDYLDLTAFNYTSLLKHWYLHLFGVPPLVYRWHYRWREYRSVMDVIQESVTPTNCKNTIVFYDTYQVDFMRYCKWFRETMNISHHYHVKNLKCSESKLNELQATPFELCILMIRLDDLEKIDDAFTLIKKVIKKNGKVLMLIVNENNRYSSVIYDFLGEFTYKMHAVIGKQFNVVNPLTIHNNLTLLGMMGIYRINKIFAYNRKWRILSYCIIGLPSSLFCFIWNSLPKLLNKKGHCTNIIVTLTPEGE